jgi:hypothetical protein
VAFVSLGPGRGRLSPSVGRDTLQPFWLPCLCPQAPFEAHAGEVRDLPPAFWADESGFVSSLPPHKWQSGLHSS